MRYRFKNILFILFLIVGLIGTARFCHHATKGFRLSKIQSNLLLQDPITLASEDAAFLNSLFQQKFTFLARGLQSFVFVSEDGQYVLKLFNNRYHRKIQFFSFLASFPFIGSWAKERMHYCQDKLKKAANSYAIAIEEMGDKTALLSIHLSPSSNLTSKITIVDPLCICHQLDPNEMGFLIQKKATLVYPYLAQLNIHEAKNALSSLLQLFHWKWNHQIDDNDPLIRTNYGFIDGHAVQIDVGPLSKRADRKDRNLYKMEMQKITESLKFWLEQNAPELVAFLDDEVRKV